MKCVLKVICLILLIYFYFIGIKKFYEGITVSPSLHDRRRPKCHVCNKTFFNKPNLKRHMEIHFLERKVYACHLCTKSFSWKTDLSTHIKMMH